MALSLGDFSDNESLAPMGVDGNSIDEMLESGCRIIVNPFQAEITRFEITHKEQLDQLDMALKNSGIRSLSLEGGHIYSDETVSNEHRGDLKVTALLRGHLLRLGMSVSSVLFVDDFHPKESTLDVDAYVEEARAQGWPIDHVFNEKDMVPTADIIVDTLRRIATVLPEEMGLKLRAGSKKVNLLNPTDGQPSCALLDSVLSLVKFELLGSEGIVNVLGRRWSNQQANMRAIVKAYLPERKRLPFFNFYTPDDSSNKTVAGRPHWAT